MKMQYYDVSVYQYGNDYRVCYKLRSISDKVYISDDDYDSDDLKIGDRFLSSVSRAKNTILGYGKCNSWDYFVTFTLDKFKYDRYDLSKWRKDFSQYIRNQRRISNNDLKYLLIPERHADGAWHMHGLITGIDWNDLSKFDSSKHPLKLVTSGYRYHDGILNKFGFNSWGKLRNRDAAAAYCLKYAGKGFALQDMDSGTHLYYASQGLNKPILLTEGFSECLLTEPDYQGEFCSISWIKSHDLQRVISNLR